ncbi:glutaredoxin-domain-containing protein [Meira miltonrushii]|uniref:Glutaredoxin-domain-containing protein n=1 Tax=Meira miltonrushii TaxID=1280837 RepID=A0A316VBX1_9BASI|nr:glutaredoxin-domain-containing protein [Meira miltonrushii]PWN34970.1 glutaredoxin-domain-containing protein [Meira miltonrushii]
MSRLRSTMHSINMHSEKGLPLPASSSSHVSARPRRRRVIIFFLLVLITCVFLTRRSDFDEFMKSKPLDRFTKNGTFKVPLPQPTDEDVDQHVTEVLVNDSDKTELTESENDKGYAPTDALRKLASTLHIPVPPSEPHEAKINPAAPLEALSGTPTPSHTDHVLLLLNAVKSKTYSIPAEVENRLNELRPKTALAFSHALSLLNGTPVSQEASHSPQPDSDSNIDDARMYMESYDSWLSKHRKQSPLTVFSKSYCPYSRRAKELLTKMGAQFDLYEVDLRPDAQALQQGLKEVSGHSTFPTIFVQDSLIGGSDDLLGLESTGVLRGILEAAASSSKPTIQNEERDSQSGDTPNSPIQNEEGDSQSGEERDSQSGEERDSQSGEETMRPDGRERLLSHACLQSEYSRPLRHTTESLMVHVEDMQSIAAPISYEHVKKRVPTSTCKPQTDSSQTNFESYFPVSLLDVSYKLSAYNQISKMQARTFTYVFLTLVASMAMLSKAAPIGKIEGREFSSNQTPTPGQGDTCYTLC